MSSTTTPANPDPPDDKVVGDWRVRRERYLFVQGALRLLHGQLANWNTTATMSGASSGPYEDELYKLTLMIEWAEERLADKNRQTILVNGISVDSLRTIKAALILQLSAYRRDRESEDKKSWPERVRESLRQREVEVQGLIDSISFKPADILFELHPELIAPSPAQSNQTWDVFISHASEDKATFVDGLASALTAAGLAVWYDKFQLRLGDSLRRSIDTGLANSKYGLVVLSPAFFAKSWPQRELDGIVSKETNSGKILLPVWHNVDFEYILKYSPMLADRIGVLSSRGVHEVAKAILAAIEK